MFAATGPVLSKPVMRVEISRVECNGAFEGALGFRRVAHELQGVATRNERIAEPRCKLDGSLARRDCIGRSSPAGILPDAQQSCEHISEPGMGMREGRVEAYRLAKQFDCGPLLRLLFLVQKLAAAQVEVIRGEVARALAVQARYVFVQQLNAERFDDVTRDLILDGEDILHLAIERLRPEMEAVRHLDELRRDSHPIAGLAHTAFEKRLDIEEPADFTAVHGLVLELKRR